MTPTVVAEVSNRLGESALWHEATKTLMWLDLFERRLFVLSPASGALRSVVLPLEAPLGAAVETDDPDTVLVTHPRGIARVRLRDGSVSGFADPEAGRDEVSYNDCKVDRFGRLWVGTSHLPEKDPRGSLWCLDQTGRATLGDTGFVVSNGPAFSPDGSRLYFNDTFGRSTFVYDIAPEDSHPRNRRLLVAYEETEGYPDGLTVDAEGCLWVAHWAGARVTRIAPNGERLAVIPFPCRNVTSVCFGGAAHETLFVTTARDGDAGSPAAGHVFAVSPGVAGLPEMAFRASGT
jgi:sugar lactone lactonase YvrE